MFCIQEAESPHSDPFRSSDIDPLITDSSDDEPNAKRLKFTPELNLQVYQIPAYPSKSLSNCSNLSIFPTSTNSLPKFVNNPLNLANPLAFATSNLTVDSVHTSNIVKSLHSRYSLPSKLTITPVTKPVTVEGEVVRYKKNGEIAKKRGPPKGYKRKPKDQSQSLVNGALLQVIFLQSINFLLYQCLALIKVNENGLYAKFKFKTNKPY